MLLERFTALGVLTSGDSASTLEVGLPVALTSPALARQELRKACERWGVTGSAAEAAELLATELVTNAVIHAGTPVLMMAEHDGHNLTIAVSDGEARLPTLSPVSVLAEGGRGVPIIDELGATWGVQRTVLGKTVWVSLDTG
ncbi:MAG: ATP-binding protein [Actinomycetes bacterium]